MDVAVIGAGMAGLVCAQALQQAGHQVVVIEKSRGLGGRMATRRLPEAWADHGVRYLSPQGALSQQLIHRLHQQERLSVWTPAPCHYPSPGGIPSAPTDTPPCYVAETGLSSVAHALAQGLDIRKSLRVVQLEPDDRHWRLTVTPTGSLPPAAALDPTASIDSPLTATPTTVTASIVVLAIPAPQALDLLQPIATLPVALLDTVRSVTFDPCLTAIATFSTPPMTSLDSSWSAVHFSNHPTLAWVSWEQSKRRSTGSMPPSSSRPTLVIQSTAAIAQSHLEATDLSAIGAELLEQARQTLSLPLPAPDSLQVHRWRYAIPSHPLPQRYLSTTTPLPLVCIGDWCGGHQIEAALQSGFAAADFLQTLMPSSDRHSLDSAPEVLSQPEGLEIQFVKMMQQIGW